MARRKYSVDEAVIARYLKEGRGMEFGANPRLCSALDENSTASQRAFAQRAWTAIQGLVRLTTWACIRSNACSV